jgi:hypothetical protein
MEVKARVGGGRCRLSWVSNASVSKIESSEKAVVEPKD